MTYRSAGIGIFGGVGVDTVYDIYAAPPPPPSESWIADKVNTETSPESEETGGMSTGAKVAIGAAVLAVAVGVVYIMGKK
jgi:hypothetical protein